jgi:hypothetical protein
MIGTWGNASTWNSMASGLGADGAEAILAANGTVASTVQGQVVTFDVTESLFAWMSGAPNYGWAVLPGGTDGWRFDSSEAGIIDLRPLLEVDYFLPGLGGDANLDGVVGLDDLALVDRGFAKNLTGWGNGDFNGDGVINQADYLLIDTALARQEGGLSESLVAAREAQFGAEYVAALTAAVPEPGVLSVAGLAMVGLGRRRR